MNQPRIERPTVRDLDRGGTLVLLDGSEIDLADTERWRAFLSGAATFAVKYPLGTYLAIGERRQRGGRYWVARAYRAGRRANAYLGRRPDTAGLQAASAQLLDTLGPVPEVTPAPTAALDVAGYVEELLRTETDPARRAAAEALRGLLEGRA